MAEEVKTDLERLQEILALQREAQTEYQKSHQKIQEEIRELKQNRAAARKESRRIETEKDKATRIGTVIGEIESELATWKIESVIASVTSKYQRYGFNFNKLSKEDLIKMLERSRSLLKSGKLSSTLKLMVLKEIKSAPPSKNIISSYEEMYAGLTRDEPNIPQMSTYRANEFDWRCVVRRYVLVQEMKEDLENLTIPEEERRSKIEGLERQIGYFRKRLNPTESPESTKAQQEGQPPARTKSRKSLEINLEDSLEKIREARSRENYVAKTIEMAQSGATPGIVCYEQGYSLVLGNSLVLQLNPDGNYQYIFAEKANKPFKMKKRTNAPQQDQFRLCAETVGLGMQDFVTKQGIKLYGAARDIADEIFAKVRTGRKIFPPERVGERYYEEIPKEEQSKVDTHPRHWGQSYLVNRNPERTIQGELFPLGTRGHSFTAYQFRDKIVVESDKENDATYILDAARFEELRQKGREWILVNKPKGFYARIIHLGEKEPERQKWKQQLEQVLAGQF